MKKTTYKYTAKLMREGRHIYVINNDLSVIRLPTMVRADGTIDNMDPARMIHSLIKNRIVAGHEIPFDYTVLHDYDNDDWICPFTDVVLEDKVTVPTGASVHGVSALESMEILKQITVEEITIQRGGAVYAHLHLNGANWASKVVDISKEEK